MIIDYSIKQFLKLKLCDLKYVCWSQDGIFLQIFTTLYSAIFFTCLTQIIFIFLHLLLLRYEQQRENLSNQSFNIEQQNFSIQQIKDTKTTVSIKHHMHLYVRKKSKQLYFKANKAIITCHCNLHRQKKHIVCSVNFVKGQRVSQHKI